MTSKDVYFDENLDGPFPAVRPRRHTFEREGILHVLSYPDNFLPSLHAFFDQFRNTGKRVRVRVEVEELE